MCADAPSLPLSDLNEKFERATPTAVLRWALETYGTALALVTSFQPTGIATLQMLAELRDETGLFPRVLTVDTGLLFPETYALIETIEQRFDITVERVTPRQTIAEQNAAHGDALWESQPDACCNLRKVAPLADALRDVPAWIAGLRRDQPGREHTPIVSYDRRHDAIKLSPFANWDEETLAVYIQMYDLPVNPLHAAGYASIGCLPCTRPAAGGLNSRAGRWAGHDKIECGIHL